MDEIGVSTPLFTQSIIKFDRCLAKKIRENGIKRTKKSSIIVNSVSRTNSLKITTMDCTKMS